jgi:hypothetical protein
MAFTTMNGYYSGNGNLWPLTVVKNPVLQWYRVLVHWCTFGAPEVYLFSSPPLLVGPELMSVFVTN